MNIHKNEGETEMQYLWRLGTAKSNGLIDLTWTDIADLINKEFCHTENPFGESKYRKTYQCGEKFLNEGVFDKDNDEETRLIELRQEIKKERQKMYDERNELNRKLREQARREEFIEIITKNISSIPPIEFDYVEKPIIESDNDLICHITDIHAGMEIDNWYNKFDADILKQRLMNYLDQLFAIQKRHNSENCYVVIGEIMSGLIHETLRIENNENVIQQFIMISSILSDVISRISYHFNNVYVYITPGNHSRVIANKEHALRGENFDILLPHYLKASLQNFYNVYIGDNMKDCEIAMFDVRGIKVMGVHGDRDNPNNVVQRFTMIFGIKPDIVLMGHMHTNSLTTVYDTKVIQSGCISGCDNYCIDKRLKNRPEQTVSVVDENGLVCIYDIKVD